MKKGITTLLILFATTVAAFSQSVESISYYEKNPSLGGDVKILKCTKSITEAQTFTTFEVEAPVSGLLEKPRDFDPFGHAGFAHLWLQYD